MLQEQEFEFALARPTPQQTIYTFRGHGGERHGYLELTLLESLGAPSLLEVRTYDVYGVPHTVAVSSNDVGGTRASFNALANPFLQDHYRFSKDDVAQVPVGRKMVLESHRISSSRRSSALLRYNPN